MDIISTLFLFSNSTGAELASSSPKGFGFNSNILEANVINIVILGSGVFYLLRDGIVNSLEDREKEIIRILEDAETRVKQSSLRLAEAEKQLNETNLVIQQLDEQAKATATKYTNEILTAGKIEMRKIGAVGRLRIERADLQCRKEIREHLSLLAVQRASNSFKHYFDPELQSKLIDHNISQLGGNL